MIAPRQIPVQPAVDPVAARAERQMRLLVQLSEIGLGLARKLQEARLEIAGETERFSERGIETDRGERAERSERAERFWADSYVIEDEESFTQIVNKVCRDLGVTPDWSAWSEDGARDRVVEPDGAGASWCGDAPGLALGIVRAGRPPQQRGPPSWIR